MSKIKVEVFVAGCQVCESTIKKIKEIAFSSCDVTIYDMNNGCETNICKDKAAEYKVTKVPAIAINGKLMECCSGSMFSEASSRNAIR